MARPESRVSIGSFVDPLEGLQGAVGSLADRYDRDARAKKEQARWDISNTRAEEQAQQRRDLLAKETAKEQFLQGYDPRVGELGGRGVDRRALEGYSTQAGQDVSSVLGKYGVGTDKSIGSLSPEEQGRLGSELSGLASKMQPELRSLGTKEDVQKSVMQDVQKATGDPALAQRLADTYGSQYLGRKELTAAEEKATKEANTLRKELSDRAKYTAKLAGVGSAAARKGSSTSGKDRLYSSEDARKFAESLDLSLVNKLGMGWDTDRAADLISKGIEAYPNVPSLVREKALENLVVREGTGDTLKGSGEQGRLSGYLEEVDKLSKIYGGNGTSGSVRRNLTPEEKSMIMTLPVQSRSYEDIQRARGTSAYGDLLNRPVSTTTPAISRPAVPRETTPSQDTVATPAEEDTVEVLKTTPVNQLNPVELSAVKEDILNRSADGSVDVNDFNKLQAIKKLEAAEKYSQEPLELRSNLIDWYDRNRARSNQARDMTRELFKSSVVDPLRNSRFDPYSRNLLTPEQLSRMKQE